MAKKMSQAQLAAIVQHDSGGKYRIVQGVPAMDSKRKSRRTAAVKTRLKPAKSSSTRAASTTRKRRDADAVPDEIVFVESSNVAGTDSMPLRKAAVISGATRSIVGMQG